MAMDSTLTVAIDRAAVTVGGGRGADDVSVGAPVASPNASGPAFGEESAYLRGNLFYNTVIMFITICRKHQCIEISEGHLLVIGLIDRSSPCALKPVNVSSWWQ